MAKAGFFSLTSYKSALLFKLATGISILETNTPNKEIPNITKYMGLNIFQLETPAAFAATNS